MTDFIKIEILKDAIEAEVEVNIQMLLVEARRKGYLKIRTQAGDIFEIKHLGED